MVLLSSYLQLWGKWDAPKHQKEEQLKPPGKETLFKECIYIVAIHYYHHLPASFGLDIYAFLNLPILSVQPANHNFWRIHLSSNSLMLIEKLCINIHINTHIFLIIWFPKRQISCNLLVGTSYYENEKSHFFTEKFKDWKQNMHSLCIFIIKTQ